MTIPTSEKTNLITLVGPPNSGKTTLFNLLSGKNFKTVNYPGSTVEYSTCKILSKFGIESNILDSPGIISLCPNSPDEEVAVNSLYNHPEFGSPNLVITTVDASQISRHLLLSRQLIKSGFKVIVVLTMNDILERKGFKIDEHLLTQLIGCDVVVINGRTGEGLSDLIKIIKAKLNHLLNSNSICLKQNVERISKEELLSEYREIASIEKRIIIPVSSISKAQLDNVNKNIKILNPSAKYGNNRPDELTLKIDRILLSKKWGLLFFFLIMAITFSSIFWIAEPFMGYVDNLFSYLSSSAANILGANWYSDLIADGIISGTGSVLVFLPQILILFLILGLLEDTGYLARGAMLIDRPLSKIGLNGKSFVPLLSGFACAIPAILSARTISNRRERFLTIFIIPLMSCSARLPVYALLIAFLTPQDKLWLAGIILAIIYLGSIVSSMIIAAIINKFRKGIIQTEDNSSFILELPTYRMPRLKNVFRNTFENAKQYIFRAGPIILVLSIAIWFLTYFPNHSPQINTEGLSDDEIVNMIAAERLSSSYAADLGKFIQPVMKPLGMDWRIGVSLLAAFTAREVFVSSLALIFKVTDEENIQSSILTAMRSAKNEETGKPLFTPSTIIGLIVFFIFAMQCLSTIAVSKKETGSWRIPLLQLIIFTSIAYIFTFLTVNLIRFAGFS